MAAQVDTSAATTPSPAGSRTTIVSPPSGWSLPDFRELLDHFDLIYYLAKRDVAVRYRQTAIGALWAVLQPLLLAGIFSAFFGQLTDVPSDGAPYALFALTGMTMWLFLANAIARCSESTIASSDLISKVYFPRIAVPLAAVAAPIVDFLAAFAVLVIVLVLAGETPGIQIFLAPLVFAVALAVALGIGLWLSAIIVRYRDVSLVVPFLILVLLFTTPILYPLSLVPDAYQTLYAINPLVGVLETFRWVMLPEAAEPGLLLVIPAATGLLLLASGLMVFTRAEQRFADVI